ncbi:MAG: hypothetical protein HC866_24795 [Leptolyngbyaceae cyanobacterium RU_5_1]|nr:hypothetical protein [Leptolyngbyaceae cyanobacterium RU_5_1]
MQRFGQRPLRNPFHKAELFVNLTLCQGRLRTLMVESGSSNEESRRIEGKTDHSETRSQEAQQGDTHRQVGDVSRVVREGRHFRDTETGYDVYVRGDRVVIVNPATNQQVTQFKNSRANTQKRIESGKWRPIP